MTCPATSPTVQPLQQLGVPLRRVDRAHQCFELAQLTDQARHDLFAGPIRVIGSGGSVLAEQLVQLLARVVDDRRGPLDLRGLTRDRDELRRELQLLHCASQVVPASAVAAGEVPRVPPASSIRRATSVRPAPRVQPGPRSRGPLPVRRARLRPGPARCGLRAPRLPAEGSGSRIPISSGRPSARSSGTARSSIPRWSRCSPRSPRASATPRSATRSGSPRNPRPARDSLAVALHKRSRFSTVCAARQPHMPCTPPPGGVDDEQR